MNDHVKMKEKETIFTTDGPADYHLTGVIENSGPRLNTGHYISYVKHEMQWYKIDDWHVSTIPFIQNTVASLV